MGYESIILVIISLTFALLYHFEDKEKILLKDLWIILCLGFMFGAVILNFNVQQASSIVTTTNSVSTNIITTYTYNNGITDLSPAYIIIAIVFFSVIILFAVQGIFDILNIFGWRDR